VTALGCLTKRLHQNKIAWVRGLGLATRKPLATRSGSFLLLVVRRDCGRIYRQVIAAKQRIYDKR